jgi:hypothetical protein
MTFAPLLIINVLSNSEPSKFSTFENVSPRASPLLVLEINKSTTTPS